MEELGTKGIIIGSAPYGEQHKLLTLLTSELGVIHAFSYGALRSTHGKGARTQLLSYGDFYLRRKKDAYTIQSVNIKEGFYPIYESLSGLALVSYITDVTTAAIGYENQDIEAMRMFLNAVYALAYMDIPEAKIKAVFELRLMSECGYMPVIRECVICGGKDGLNAFSPIDGGVICSRCIRQDALPLTPIARAAMEYILCCAPKRIFSFDIPAEDMECLCKICEKYVSVTLDRGFKSLKYYNKVK